jgi:hypothetical protein
MITVLKVLQYLSMATSLAGFCWFCYVQFRLSLKWGLACLLIPCAWILFTIRNWDVSERPFWLCICSWIVLFASTVALTYRDNGFNPFNQFLMSGGIWMCILSFCWMWKEVFRRSFIWGVAGLFIPICWPIFAIRNWKGCQKPFVIGVAGLAIMFIAVATDPHQQEVIKQKKLELEQKMNHESLKQRGAERREERREELREERRGEHREERSERRSERER